jgi:branched-chain amino acid transport system substrate-binding protein
MDPFQGWVIAKFASSSLGIKKIAIIKDIRNEYSVGLAEFFSNEFRKNGGDVIAEQAYSEGDNDFKAQLTAIKAANPEAIFVPGYYNEAALICKQARELKINVPMLGGDGWDSAKLLEIGGDAMNNTYYCNHYSPDDTTAVVQNFVNKYREQFHQTPDALAVLGYDAGRILFDAIRRAGTTDGPALRDAIGRTANFPGVAGVVTINAERNATKSAVIVQIQNGKSSLKERITPPNS